MRAITICLVSVFMALSGTASAQPRYTIRVLEPPATFNFSGATAINERGEVIGSLSNLGRPAQAFLWSESEGMTHLENPWFGEGATTEARFLADNGRIGGQAETSDHDDPFVTAVTQGFTYSGGTMTNIGNLVPSAPAYSRTSFVHGMSASGTFVGHSNNVTFSWTAGVFTPLEDILGSAGVRRWEAYVVADDGTLAGYRWLDGEDQWTGFVHDGSLEIIDHPDIANETVRALSPRNGWVTGWGLSLTGDRAFIWEENAKVTISIGDGHAVDINSDGVVVGQELTSPRRAMIYTENTWQPLYDLVDDPGDWMRLESAAGINDRGQIVGTGSLSGLLRAFILDPVDGSGPQLEVTVTEGVRLPAQVTYEVQVENTGLVVAPDVALQLLPPDDTTYVEDFRFEGSCTAAPDAYRVDCMAGTLEPGERFTVGLPVALPGDGDYTLRAIATTAGEEYSGELTQRVNDASAADLVIQELEPSPVVSLDLVNSGMTCRLRNEGLVEAEDVVVRVSVTFAEPLNASDATVTIRSGDASTPCGRVMTMTAEGSGSIECPVGTLAVDQEIEVMWQVDETRAQFISGSVSARTSTPELRTDNNSCGVSTGGEGGMPLSKPDCSAGGSGPGALAWVFLIVCVLRRRSSGAVGG